jgi:hypothetical protein
MDEQLPKIGNLLVAHPDAIDDRDRKAAPLLDKLVEEVESAKGHNQKLARKRLGKAMLDFHYHEHRGWMWVYRFFVHLREGCDEEARAWLAERGFAHRSSPAGRSRSRELGQFFERLGVWPPEELFELKIRHDARRISRKRSSTRAGPRLPYEDAPRD